MTTPRSARNAPLGPAHIVGVATDRVGPSWFTSVMGTGILAVDLVTAPLAVMGETSIGRALFIGNVVLFALLASLWLLAIVRSPRAGLASLGGAATAQAWGAPPMACFTLAVGCIVIGAPSSPSPLWLAAAQGLYVAGVMLAISSAFVVPYLMFTTHAVGERDGTGTWLLPVVPPIVASVPAALLADSWPAAWRDGMLVLAFALLGIGVVLAAIVIVVFYTRLVYHKVPEGPLVPSMWIVVGPLGQSIAGSAALGGAAVKLWPALGPGLAHEALAYGLLVWGFALYWLAMAIAVTLRAVARRLPFTLGWWAFTFPVGVLTAGTSALYRTTHVGLFAVVAAGLVALLAALWSLVAIATLRGIVEAIRPGETLLGAPRPATEVRPAGA